MILEPAAKGDLEGCASDWSVVSRRICASKICLVPTFSCGTYWHERYP